MNNDTLTGQGREIGGAIKEGIGDAVGDPAIKNEGVADQVLGNVQQSYGAARDAVANGVGPLADQAKRFARERPWATAALVGTLALALINTLRGKK
ncbi:MAG: CsbD family protein [Sphingomonas bacterium]|jgi:uncharacterized protein YjbJ (UPF0337 family)|uniref:CsbD family protein n=1 Tax=Sphingomonas bacterium TaxID=1895847 RepID=UPI002629824F|nr:CsbD family protein [Sphingomonas bacterium]MDB5705376.1 CsbD family protein [Sphingomonas bacterium]